MMALTVPCTLGWLLITFARNVEMIYLGRIVTG